MPSTSNKGWVIATRDDCPFLDALSDDNDIIEAGKWMLFYPKSEMDKRWIDACELLHFGELGVVKVIQASTFRQDSYQNGVIACYIERTKRDTILETGRLIMDAMKYQDTMFYKTNQQTKEAYNAALSGESTVDLKKHTLQLSPQYQCPFDDATCLQT